MDQLVATGSLLAWVIQWLIVIFCAVFGAMVLAKIWTGRIGVPGLISDPAGEDGTQTSVSRLQFVVFTGIVSILMLVLSLKAGSIIEIPYQILLLLGLSAAIFVVFETIPRRSAPSFVDDFDAPAVPDFNDDLIAADRFKTYLIGLGKEVPKEVLRGMAELMAEYGAGGDPATPRPDGTGFEASKAAP
jgi:hypothetical protein